jgi:hypothetical protein
LAACTVHAANIDNPGFEDGWTGWTDGDPSASGTALSDVAHGGVRSVKLSCARRADPALLLQEVAGSYARGDLCGS